MSFEPARVLASALSWKRYIPSFVLNDSSQEYEKRDNYFLIPKSPLKHTANTKVFNDAAQFLFLNLLDMKNSVFQRYTNLLFRFGYDPRLPEKQRKKIVVLGTGWASMNFIRRINVAKYDVVVISPSAHFSFTPLLPSVCAGVLSARACIEPIHNKLTRGGKKVMQYYQGSAIAIDSQTKTIKCKGKEGDPFQVDYDYILVGVGSKVNTFGIPGVQENTLFLKDVHDAKTIHERMLSCFEKAALPTTDLEKKKKLLHFVMVGAGPSGVETAGEISDFIKREGKKHYPEIAHLAKVSIIEMLPVILPAFLQKVSDFALETLRKNKVDVHLKTRVVKITPDAVHVVNESGKSEQLPYGFVLWASGIGPAPFTQALVSSLPIQNQNRVLKVDERLRIIGLPGGYAIGDCSWVSPNLLLADAEKLYEKAKKANKVSVEYLQENKKQLCKEYPQLASYNFDKLPKTLNMTKQEFIQMLKDIDTVYRPPPPTAQAAAQAGTYLSKIFNTHTLDSEKEKAPAYNFVTKGIMCYVAGGNSVIQTPSGTILGGFYSHLIWKTLYFIRQMSTTNKALCIFDWCRTTLRGRDMSAGHSK